MKALSICMAALLCLSYAVNAQVAEGAYGYYMRANDFAKAGLSGSARMRAMGGAQVALGADPGSMNINPAGLGLMRNSNFSFTGNVQLSSSQSTFESGQNTSVTNDFKPGFNLPNISIVFADRYDNPESSAVLKGQSFGISVNQSVNFSNKYSYSGRNETNGNFRNYLIDGVYANDLYAQDLVGNTVDLYSVAYQTFAINNYVDYDSVAGEYYDSEDFFTPDASNGSGMQQSENINISGFQNETSFSYGGNYDDKIFFGFSLGIPRVRYSIERTYEESIQGGVNLKSMVLEEEEVTTGTGVNASFGIIVRPTDFVRIGASIKSPSFIWLTEKINQSLTTNFNSFVIDHSIYDPNSNTLDELDNLTLTGAVDERKFNYTLLTPMRANVGASFFFGKKGFVSTDLEYVPNGSSKLTSSSYSLSGDNTTIANLYGNAVNLRLGGEYRYKIFRVRAGAALMGNTYADGTDLNDAQNYITFGFGIKKEQNALDFAVVNTSSSTAYEPYSLDNGLQPSVDLASKRTQVMVTYAVSF